MKRIAVVAAFTIAMLAIPTAAMAGTTGSGPGYGGPPPVTVAVACPAPFRLHYKGHHKLQIVINRHLTPGQLAKLRKHHKPIRFKIFCARLQPVRPHPKPCQDQALTFSVNAGSSKLTEVSGPILSPAQQFTYDGSTYTIMTVNPGADSFTVFLNNFLFVNSGAAITNATGYMSCTS